MRMMDEFELLRHVTQLDDIARARFVDLVQRLYAVKAEHRTAAAAPKERQPQRAESKPKKTAGKRRVRVRLKPPPPRGGTVLGRCIELAQTGPITSIDVARELNIERKHASACLSTLKKRGLLIHTGIGQPYEMPRHRSSKLNGAANPGSA